jgi:hypothetical protein
MSARMCRIRTAWHCGRAELPVGRGKGWPGAGTTARSASWKLWVRTVTDL